MEETLDPKSHADGAAGADERAPVAAMLVLFHADLRRVEDEFRFGPANVDSAQVLVGRDAPDFSTPSGHPAGPLRDPCISRKQFTVRYLASPPRFEIVVAPDARRAIRCFTAEGHPLEPIGGCVPASSLIAIGDRVLVWVGLQIPSPPGSNFEIVGTSNELRTLRRQIRALASESATVLVRGETGTGKELVARALHFGGPRAAEPFVAVNCAAIPDALVDAELFGYEKGAFSGAASSREGLFRAAAGGTLFLDEVGELSAAAQAKLLRALQACCVRPVGGTREHPFAARIVAATHRPLAEDVASGRFRADLLARLELPRIDVPPLRSHRVDIPLLFVHFLVRTATSSGLTGSYLRAATGDAPAVPMAFVLSLMGRAWSKNIRELEKATFSAELAYRTTGRWRFDATDVPPVTTSEHEAPANPSASPPRTRGRPAAETLVKMLDEHAFVQRRVADELGVSRTTLDKWLREYGIRRPSDVEAAEIERAHEAHQGDHERVAAALRISLRGLKQRLRELRMHSNDD